jgi:glutamine phosphoribosylpyrophosphate amidotransferase
MCSIIGYSGEYKKSLVNDILKNSRIRGLHSFGYCFFENKQIKIFKFLDYNDFLKSINKNKPNKFIAHFRYSTSGDYKVEKNNQPIKKQNTALVFNGVLDMGTKRDMEEIHNVILETDNDGELALIKYNESDNSVLDFIKNKTFAGIFINENEIKALRNKNRPAYVGFYDDIKIITSTKDILQRSSVLNFIEIPKNNFYVI